jgi:tripeptide aminopeptidase
MKYEINRERLTDCFTRLAEIASPSFSEYDVFAFVRDSLAPLGCGAKLQEYCIPKKNTQINSANLIAVLEATDPALPPLALAAHADTVAPCRNIRVVRDGDRLASDGTTVLGGDDKSAIAEIIETLRIITENKLPHGRVEVIITSAEEIGLIGAKNLDRAHLRAAHCLVLDSGGEIGSAVIAAPYQVSFEILCRGKKAHAGIEPEKGISAIAAAAEVIHAFPTGRLDQHSVANFGSITGGGAETGSPDTVGESADNIVPDLACITGEIRSHDKKLLEDHRARLEKACRGSEEKFGARIELTITPEYDGFAVPPDHPLLAVVREAAGTCALPFSAIVTGGGSDANVLTARGLSCLNLACGMHAVHTTEEYVLISEMEKMSEMLVSILTEKTALLKG